MKLDLDPEYEAFRADVSETLTKNRHLAPTSEDKGYKNARRIAWQKLLIEHGLAARTIPKAYGGYGGEADILKARIIAEEFARSRVPGPMAGQGISMLVPTLLELGTPVVPASCCVTITGSDASLAGCAASMRSTNARRRCGIVCTSCRMRIGASSCGATTRTAGSRRSRRRASGRTRRCINF